LIPARARLSKPPHNHDGFSRSPLVLASSQGDTRGDGARDLGGGSRAAAMRAAGLPGAAERARARRVGGGGAGEPAVPRPARCTSRRALGVARVGLGAGPDDASAPVREGRSGPRAFVRASRLGTRHRAKRVRPRPWGLGRALSDDARAQGERPDHREAGSAGDRSSRMRRVVVGYSGFERHTTNENARSAQRFSRA